MLGALTGHVRSRSPGAGTTHGRRATSATVFPSRPNRRTVAAPVRGVRAVCLDRSKIEPDGFVEDADTGAGNYCPVHKPSSRCATKLWE